MSKEQRHETSRNRFSVGRAKSFIIGGLAAAAFVASAEGCQESDKTALLEPSPVSTHFTPEPPKIAFDSPEANKKAEFEDFNRKITTVVDYMARSEIPQFSKTAAKWKQLSSEKRLFYLRLQTWEEGAKIGLTSRGEELIRVIAFNPAFLQVDANSIRSTAVAMVAMEIQSTILEEVFFLNRTEGESLEMGIRKLAADPGFEELNARINSLGWKDAMRAYDFAKVDADTSPVGNIAKIFINCQSTGDFDSCWAEYFKPRKKQTAFNFDQRVGQSRQIPLYSHVAQS